MESSAGVDKKPQPNNSTNPVTVETLDIEILPVIYDIIRGIEKDPTDNAAKQRESQDCSQKVLELQKRIESARNQIKQLPGIDYNIDEQLQRLETLRNQLSLKQQLIKSYLVSFQCDIPLAGREYIPCDETNNPCCLVCYDHLYGKKCQRCQLAIKPTEKGVSWDKTNWHERCFRCVGQDCNKSLIGQRFCIKSSFPFCSSKCIGTRK